MRAWMALLAVVPACGFQSPATGDAASVDAKMPDAQACFGMIVPVCFTVIPTAPVTLSGNAVINTDDPLMCDQNNNQPKYCVIAGAGVTLAIGAKLRAYGSKPLVLLSTMTIDLSGDIDVSSNHSDLPPMGTGAGATSPDAMCSNTTSATGTSGGFGGSFGGKGGNGEDSPSGDGSKGLSATPLSAFPMVLRGGCPGGAGAAVTVAGGAGGAGGGAVAIVATKIQLNGNINASGAGGRGGLAIKSGGGGGGSGGMIVLDSPMILLGSNPKPSLYANGGGGGQGGPGDAVGGPGKDGDDPMGPTKAALGGSGTGVGGDGGAGSFSTTLFAQSPTGNAQTGGGGGGGGGGAGFIHASGVTDLMVIAPPSLNP